MGQMLLVASIVCFSVGAADKQPIIEDAKGYLTDDNYTIGRKDQLMLERLVSEKGVAAVQATVQKHKFFEMINKHLFESKNWDDSTIKMPWPQPFVVEYIINKTDKSPLSEKIFFDLHLLFCSDLPPSEWGHLTIFEGNRLNNENPQLHRNSPTHYSKSLCFWNRFCRIDYCTEVDAMDDDKSPGYVDTVKVWSRFYHQKSLLEALKIIAKNKTSE